MEELNNDHIKEFLENAPLYTWKEYKKPKINRSSLWIKEIEAFCETCNQSRPFQDLENYGSGSGMAVRALSSGYSFFRFTCVSCKKQHRRYCVEQILTEQTIKMQKYGELPRRQLDRDRLLQKFFSKDSDCYEKAVVCLAHGYGIAAFAYFRRIIENNILLLLDMLQQDVESSEGGQEIKDALNELRKESPMSERIKLAKKALPDYLSPGGINPLGKLYQILSEGVHSLSDDECLKRANTVSECLKFLIGELQSRKNNRERFKGMVGEL